MKKESIFKELNTLGNVNVYYSLAKSIGIVPAFLLGRLLSEQNYAEKHGFVDCYGSFITSVSVLKQVGLSVEEIYDGINLLSNLQFLYLYQYDDHDSFMLNITLYKENIIKYVREKEVENNYQNWDFGLTDVQKIILKRENIIAKRCNLKRARQLIEAYTNNTQIQDAFVDFVDSLHESYNLLLSDGRLQNLIAILDSLADTEEKQLKIIEHAIGNGYKSFFPLN